MIIAFDTETHGFDWHSGQTAFLGSWADADGEYVEDLTNSEGRREFTLALAEASTIVAHNLSFDTHQLRETTGYDLRTSGHELHDTDLLARLVNPVGNVGGFGFRLKDLASSLLYADAGDQEKHMKEMGKSIGVNMNQAGAYYEVWRAYPDVMENYAKQDARITYDLFEYLMERATPDNLQCYDLEMATAKALIDAEARGLAVDQAAVEELYGQYAPEAERLEASVKETLGLEALTGEGSEEALTDALLAHGVPLYRTTKNTQKLATHKFALQEFEDDYPVLSDFMEWRRVDKFLTTYINPMRGRDEVHTSFRQSAAWTGRMSSVRPNMQNLPKRAGREVRRPIVARPGHKLVVCDYDGIEARLLAWYMNDEHYRQMFRDGVDPHAWMAAQIHGGTVEDFDKDGPRGDERDQAKNVLFAISYGAGAPRVSDMTGLPKKEAKDLIAKIKGSLPKYHKLMGRIRKKITSQGYVSTLYGRQQRVDPEKSYVGLNALIQGSAAYLMKQGLVNVHEAVAEYDALPLLVVHDEVVVESPEDCAEDVLTTTISAMEAAYELDPPLQVSGSVVDNYMEA